MNESSTIALQGSKWARVWEKYFYRKLLFHSMLMIVDLHGGVLR